MNLHILPRTLESCFFFSLNGVLFGPLVQTKQPDHLKRMVLCFPEKLRCRCLWCENKPEQWAPLLFALVDGTCDFPLK